MTATKSRPRSSRLARPAQDRTDRRVGTGRTVRPPADDLWAEFRKTRSDEARNALVERYLPLAWYIADRERGRLPAEVDPDDLRQAAACGLMKAIDLFDPDRGFKFETFCASRLRGAMLDELRHMDWVPRLVRSRTTRMDRARNEFELAKGRAPTDQELRSAIGATESEYRKLQRDSRPITTVSLDRPRFDGDSGRETREIDTISDSRLGDPGQPSTRRDLLRRITRGMTREERLVVALYYYENLTMREIGDVLALSESRVSQMHTSIIARLKSTAAEWGVDLID